MTFEEMLDRNGYLVFTNVGDSMMPLLRQNRDVLHIRKAEAYHTYDAVLFRRDNGQYILHRILREQPEGFYIVGDNRLEGEMVRRDQVLGVLDAVVRDGKRIPMCGVKYRIYLRSRALHRLYLRLRHLGGCCLRRLGLR